MPWRITEVTALTGFRLKVRFRDGLEGLVDMTNLIMSKQAGVFTVLRDVAIFSQVRVEHGAVTWPGELDLAPDAMYSGIKQNGIWVPE